MPPKPVKDLSFKEWIRRAKSNLSRARQKRPKDVLWEDLCFDCQQAGEKAIKGLLLAKKIPFRFVHDLAELLTAAENAGVFLPLEIRAATALTNYAVESRYPGPFDPVTEEEFKEALKMAEDVVQWVEKLINE